MNTSRNSTRVLRLAILAIVFVESYAHAHDDAEAVMEPFSVPVATAISAPADSAQGPSEAEAPSDSQPSTEAEPEEFQLPLEKHLWTKFLPGAWREVEITTEVFNQAGQSMGQSVTSQREQLQSIAEDTYILHVSAGGDYSTETVDATPITRALKMLTDSGGQVFQTLPQSDQLLPFGEGTISADVWDVVFSDDSKNLRQRVYYSPEVFPFILRREIFESCDDSPVEQVPLERTEVIVREVPYTFQGNSMPCVGLRTTRSHLKGSTETLQFLNPEIPGGEVVSWSTDFDSQGRRIRWTVRETRNCGSVNDNLSQQAASPKAGSVP